MNSVRQEHEFVPDSILPKDFGIVFQGSTQVSSSEIRYVPEKIMHRSKGTQIRPARLEVNISALDPSSHDGIFTVRVSLDNQGNPTNLFIMPEQDYSRESNFKRATLQTPNSDSGKSHSTYLKSQTKTKWIKP